VSCVAPGIHVMMETTRKRQYNRMLVINVSTPNVTVARSSGNSIYGSVASQINRGPLDILRLPPRPPQKKITRLISDSSNLITDSYQVKMAKLHVINTQIKEIVKLKNKLVRQQDAYLAIRPAYPRGCCPRAAKGDKTYLQPVFLHR